MIATDPATALDRLADPVFPLACLIVVHPDPETAVIRLRDLTRHRQWPEIEIGRELSATLLPLPASNRSRQASQWLRERIAELVSGPAVLTRIDLLFEPVLELDPLALLRQMSRVRSVVAAWPGLFDASGLSYGDPGHAHYRTWRNPSVEIVALPR